METQTISLDAFHKEIVDWQSNVQFAKSEIQIFQKQLSEITAKNSEREVLQGVEHFQNQFIRQLEVSDELGRELRKTDHRLAEKASNGNSNDTLFVEDNINLRDKAITYVKLFNELKDEYHSFLEKWM